MNPTARIKLLQLARRELGLTEEDYRAILAAQGGYARTKDIVRDDRAFDRVTAHLRRLGFKSTAHRRAFDREDHLGTMATRAQVGLIRELWQANAKDKSDAALDRWLESKFKVSSLRFLPIEKARKVIAALKAWRERLDAKGGSTT